MEMKSKFSAGDGPPGVVVEEFTFPDIWQEERFSDFSRLMVGSRQGEVKLILDLCRPLNGPFGVLFVLLASRSGREAARYQCSEPVSFEDLELFLYSFQEFFEQDGRHEIWVSSLSGEGQFIFDQHNFIYAYGDLDRISSHLGTVGYARGEIQIPVPHQHHFHPQFDHMEDEMMQYWTWLKSPLGNVDAE